MRSLNRFGAIAGVSLLILAGCNGAEETSTGSDTQGDMARGAELIAAKGCGTCHEIPGIDGATGRVGPPLDHMGERMFIAGMLDNTPENMRTWLMDPQAVIPGNAMPDTGLEEEEADQVAAYLRSLR